MSDEPNLFTRVGRAIGGDEWQMAIARRLGISKRTASKWHHDFKPRNTEATLLAMLEQLVGRRNESNGLIIEIRAELYLERKKKPFGTRGALGPARRPPRLLPQAVDSIEPVPAKLQTHGDS